MKIKSNGVKKFNLIIAGVGGQGLITLLQIISEAAFLEGYEVRSSELHGLSQRGGSVEVHLKFGKKIFSPIVSRGKADLILALESQEALGAAYFASKDSSFLINQYQTPTLSETISEKDVVKNLKKITSNINLIPAADICKKKFETEVVSGIFMVSYASFKNLIPLKPNSVLKTIKKIIPPKYLDLNLKTFKLADQWENK